MEDYQKYSDELKEIIKDLKERMDHLKIMEGTYLNDKYKLKEKLDIDGDIPLPKSISQLISNDETFIELIEYIEFIQTQYLNLIESLVEVINGESSTVIAIDAEELYKQYLNDKNKGGDHE